ncbi:hypothetical protein [Kitasatospora sp. NPDC058190]|uniref:hypothetical protein n=1 Tax=Kitasatospora sp. NPDC058190 TaxID=3346371 RepID=UPI0036DAE057
MELRREAPPLGPSWRGLGAPGFTSPTLQAAMFGDRDHSGEFGRDAVVALCRADPVLTATDGTTVDVRAACRGRSGPRPHPFRISPGM